MAASGVAQPEGGSLHTAAGADSAAQPASGTGERFDELQTWFDSLREDVGRHQAEISSLRFAVIVCRSNPTKYSLRRLLSSWNLPYTKNKKELKPAEMLAQAQAAIEQRAALVRQQMNAKVQPSTAHFFTSGPADVAKSEMSKLLHELCEYERLQPGTPTIEQRIKQCQLLQTLPCTNQTLQNPNVKVLHKAFGNVNHCKVKGKYMTFSMRSCHCLQSCVAEMTSVLDELDEARFPILRALQQQFGNGETLRKQDFLQSLRERHVVSPSPYCEPLSRLRFLKQDRFLVVQMLACLEMPDVALLDIPGPMRAHVLAAATAEGHQGMRQADQG